jgi:hypothetical protein
MLKTGRSACDGDDFMTTLQSFLLGFASAFVLSMLVVAGLLLWLYPPKALCRRLGFRQCRR